ncbi:hypothetical protein BJ508DRAFT_411783 [Ascobolus immersus RN42]|uniref:Zn(2)-C6 fungal-type domain-containing protein n=1 Tax=Ascobolus immersus RN42 TaxID=1160509 RepID=A0A3N4INS8_ASCIM|nr:hypothetical protein BJ508DRAFT_411783 [Ascobolus immersus RN42]
MPSMLDTEHNDVYHAGYVIWNWDLDHLTPEPDVQEQTSDELGMYFYGDSQAQQLPTAQRAFGSESIMTSHMRLNLHPTPRVSQDRNTADDHASYAGLHSGIFQFLPEHFSFGTLLQSDLESLGDVTLKSQPVIGADYSVRNGFEFTCMPFDIRLRDSTFTTERMLHVTDQQTMQHSIQATTTLHSSNRCKTRQIDIIGVDATQQACNADFCRRPEYSDTVRSSAAYPGTSLPLPSGSLHQKRKADLVVGSSRDVLQLESKQSKRSRGKDSCIRCKLKKKKCTGAYENCDSCVELWNRMSFAHGDGNLCYGLCIRKSLLRIWFSIEPKLKQHCTSGSNGIIQLVRLHSHFEKSISNIQMWTERVPDLLHHNNRECFKIQDSDRILLNETVSYYRNSVRLLSSETTATDAALFGILKHALMKVDSFVEGKLPKGDGLSIYLLITLVEDIFLITNCRFLTSKLDQSAVPSSYGSFEEAAQVLESATASISRAFLGINSGSASTKYGNYCGGCGNKIMALDGNGRCWRCEENSHGVSNRPPGYLKCWRRWEKRISYEDLVLNKT